METPPPPPPSLDHATLFKTLKDLLDERIKLAIEVQFAALQTMFTQTMEDTINLKMATLSNITAETINRTIDQIREDNTRLSGQVADLTTEVRSTLAAKTTPTWTPPATATLFH